MNAMTVTSVKFSGKTVQISAKFSGIAVKLVRFAGKWEFYTLSDGLEMFAGYVTDPARLAELASVVDPLEMAAIKKEIAALKAERVRRFVPVASEVECRETTVSDRWHGSITPEMIARSRATRPCPSLPAYDYGYRGEPANVCAA